MSVGRLKLRTRALLAAGFVFLPLVLGLLLPQVAFGQAVTNTVAADPPAVVEKLTAEAKSVRRQILGGVIAMSLIDLMSFAANRLAYDAAVAISSGGPGETALYDPTPPGQYFKEFQAAVAGEAIGLLQEDLELASGFGGAGFQLLANFNLCAPRADVLLTLNLGIKGTFERPEPKCDFNEVKADWGGFLADVQSVGNSNVLKNQIILTQLADMYDERNNEFSVGLTLYSQIFSDVLEQSKINLTKQIQADGFQGVADFITGNVETPSSLVGIEYIDAERQAKSAPFEAGRALIGNPDALLQVGIQAGSVFTNTLLSELTKKLYAGLFKFDAEWPDPFADIEAIGSSNASTAREQFKSLLAFRPLEVSNFSILSDFSSCPPNRGLYNCVADTQFINAIARADAGVPLTIEEAVEEGLIHGDWPLIPSSDLARNQDPFCYTYGFCSGNLVKLRKARVISIGWELAAESPNNSDGSPVTLQEVLDGFDVCNSEGSADSNHPWCKMIDPEWVLKYPETQCRALVNGQLLEAAAVDTRQQECVDMPSCIAEGDDGSCTGGFGYCVQEENIWRFRGEACEEQYASCLTFDGPEGDESFLQNTLDYGPCNESNAGCLWYSTQKADPDGDGTFDFQPVPDIEAADADPDTHAERIYFTSAVEECDPSDGGCRQLVERDDSLRLNVINNSSFEEDTNADGSSDGWVLTGTARINTTNNLSRTGVAAAAPNANEVMQPGITVSQGRFYTFSFFARQRGGAAQARGRLGFTSSSGDVDLRGTSITGPCQVRDAGLGGDGLGDGLQLTAQPAGDVYERFSCTFTSPILLDPAATVTAFVSFVGDVAIDDVQLEQGANVSDYHDGYSSSNFSTIVAKVPPAYLGCTGAPTDPADCANYAKVCSENDVGCTEYSPANGDPAVTGIINSLDICPAECSGYDTYKQEPTLYEPDGSFPLYFIPDTAETCSEEDVGCDEFTNLTTEGLEYYTFLRACVTESQAAANVSSDNAATFYTWEGSDLSGFQLKTWNLLESNLGAAPYVYDGSGEVDTTPGLAPCSNATATNDGMICSDAIDLNGNNAYDWDTALCDEHDDIFTNSDCREFYDSNGGIHYRLFSNTVTVNDACTAYRKTDIVGVDEAAREANCEDSGGFYDASLGTCRYYGYAAESEGCSASANGCRSYTGGRSRNSRVVTEEFFEGGSIVNWDAGSAADATLSNESLATGGHSIAATNSFSTFFFDNGNVCNAPGGCAGTAQSFAGTCTVAQGQRACGVLTNQLFTGKTYTVSFIAKGTGNLRVGFDTNANQGALNPADVPFAQVALEPDWQTFTLGPIDASAVQFPNFGNGRTALVFDPSSLAFVDNIVLREGEDNITIIKDSWETPASCDQAPTGAPSPQYNLGCQEYTTQNGATVFAKSFSRLCDSDEVGCEDFFLTQESTSPYAQIFNGTCNNPAGAAVTSPTSCYLVVNAGVFDTTSPYLCTIAVGFSSCRFSMDGFVAPDNLPAHLTYGPETEIVPADQDVFLVVNDEVTCSASDAGCQELGKPTFSQDRNSTTGAEPVFLMNDPDTYAETLCAHDALFCSAWGTENDGTFYFKDPLSQTCEYRTDVTIGGTTYDGWFRTDSEDFCYGTCTNGTTACSSDADCPGATTCNAQDPSYVVGGDYAGIWFNGDPDYGNWVGTCPEQSSTCSEFQDPLDASDEEVYGTGDGTSYFYLNNENLDENTLPDSQQCNGQVSLKEGCVLFNDTTEPSQGYNASATEMASRHADEIFGNATFDLVDPINCESGDSTITKPDGTTVDLCAKRCAYDLGALNDITDGVLAPTKIGQELVSGNGLWTIDELYTFGSSCYVASDCAPVRSQAGEDVSGTCNLTVRVNPTIDPDPRDPVPRLENDTNTVLKVNRDRQCSEWLACSDPNPVWDERTNSFRTICGDIELCNEYSSLGNSSFCSDWLMDEPEIVLTPEEYVSRDVSWYGSEYSGFAVPGIFPVQTLTQANVAPPTGACNLFDALRAGEVSQAEFNLRNGRSCAAATAATDCGNASYCVTQEVADFRLVLDAGSCTQDYGEACSVGYCESTGAACSSTADCGLAGGDCLAGVCYDVEVTACTADDDCSEGQVCLGASCATPLSDVNIDGFNRATPCPAGQTFAASVNLQNGSCIRSQCLLTPQGDRFDPGDSEGKLCRAYPEVNSPFPNEVIEQYLDTETQQVTAKEDADWDDEAYDVLSGFESVQLCAPGEICDCSYKKVTFGDVATKYLATDFQFTSPFGACTSGPRVGSSCFTDEQCGDAEATGICSLPTKEDLILGLDGYCLEKDSSINILGDRAENACLTWLPVDQLAGSTDLYAKYTGAGYFEDTYACTFASPFVNLLPTRSPPLGSPFEGEVACAESGQQITLARLSDENDIDEIVTECASQVECPAGYWAIMGLPEYKDNGFGDTMATACSGEDPNECPFVCIPFGATIIDDEGDTRSCDYNNTDDGYVDELLDTFSTGNFSSIGSPPAHVKFVGATLSQDGNDAAETTANKPKYLEFDNMVDALSDCSLKGVKLTEELQDEVIFFANSSQVFVQYESYPACQTVAQVADAGTFTGYAWTDRLRDPDNNFDAIVSPFPGLDYVDDTVPTPFGLMSDNPAAKDDEWPLVIAACSDDLGSATTTLTQPKGAAPFNSCSVPQSQYTEVDDPGDAVQSPSVELQNRLQPDDPDSRALIGFQFDILAAGGTFTAEGSTVDAMALLNQLFASTYLFPEARNAFEWNRAGTFGANWPPNPDTLEYTSGLASQSALDSATFDVRPEVGNPPTVWSLDIPTCVGSQCEEGRANAVTVNDSDSGTQTAFEFFRAYLKFYAAADKEQLPIRRIIVDWGDGTQSGSDSPDNFYKNHRGLADQSSASECDNGKEWGKTDASCDPNYFNYGHIYTCTPTLLLSGDACSDPDLDGIPNNTPCVNNKGTTSATCSFVPRVHVRDNWGWCTGTCTGSSVDGSDECYDGDGSLQEVDTAINNMDECSFLSPYPGYPASASGSSDPWVYYDGVITVDPTEGL